MTGRRSPGNWRLALGALLCCLTVAATAEPFFKPFVATFSVSRGLMPLGDLELRLNLAPDGTYSYHAHTQPGLLADWFNGEEVIEESQGRLLPEGLQPSSYLYRQEVDEADNTAVRFDWTESKAYTTSGGITWAQPIGPDTQDRLSQQLMVRLQLAQGQQMMEYEVADGGKLKLYRFQVIGKESIKTPLGRLDCLKVARSKGSRPPEYTIWFAPRLDYLPVRIERKISGRRFVMSLDELKGIEF